MHYIEDEEINLEKKDYLNTKIYADTLKKTIDSLSGNKSYTIGLFGGWGTGKSSIINTVKEAYNDSRDVAFVTYNAWQYVNDSFRRMFLLKMQQELQCEQTDMMKRFYVNESQKVDYKYVFSWKKFLAIFLITLIIVYLFLSLPIFNNFDSKLNIAMVIAICNAVISLFFKSFEKLDISITKPHLFAPEQFEDCFNEILDICFSSSPITNVMKFFNWKKSKVRGLKKLIIVFDNIDRCHHDLAYSLLTDIKTFLAPTNKNVIFVVPVDDDALKKNFMNDNCQVDQEKEEFLRKFFNTIIRIKPYAEMDMFEFAKNIAKEKGLNLKPETLYFASSAYSKNPRRIIQLYNNLEVEKLNYDETFAALYEAQICAILIIREDYPEIYKKIATKPRLLYDENLSLSEDIGKNPFMRIIAPSFRNVSIEILSKILSNTESYFISLDDNLKNSLDSFDDKYLNDNKEKIAEKKGIIIDYLFHSLQKYIRNNVASAVISSVEFYSKIYKLLDLKTEWRRFDSLISWNEYVEIYKNVSKTAPICEFIDSLALGEPSHPKAQESFVNFIIESKEPIPEFSDKQYLDCHSEEMLNKLSDKFLNQYENFNHWDNLEPIHLKHLVTNSILLSIVNNISSLEKDNKTLSRSIILLSKKKDVSEECFVAFFDKMQNLFNAKLSFENHFRMINNVISVIKDKEKSDIPKSDKIQLAFQMFDNSFTIKRPQIANKTLLDYWAKEETIDDICLYLYNRIRISGESGSIQQIVNILLVNFSSKIISLYNRLIEEKNVITVSMDEVVATLKDFTNNEQLNILKYAAQYQDPQMTNCDESKKYVFSGSVIAKIPILFNFLSQNDVVDFIVELASISIYADSITNQFSQRSDITITGRLIPLALNDFTEERVDQYKENFEFLQFVMKNGNDIQKGLVRNIFGDNIHSIKSLFETFDAIEKSWAYMSKPIQKELVAAAETLKTQAENEQLDMVEKFLEDVGKR